MRINGPSETWACNCIGPQRGEPLCPCQMRNVIKRDGRWIRREQDLGPVQTHYEFGSLTAEQQETE